jgi:uncharacterized protein YecE (DUF72 family)
MTRFWIGTSGWHYDHWRGDFYPSGLSKSEWLDFYMQRFTTVEVNNSFYRLPAAKTWDAWHQAAQPGFRFAVKGSRFISHIKRFDEPAPALKRFYTGAERLKSHLGPVLFQAPPTFKRTDENVERVERFLAALSSRHQHVIEFRHDSWFRDETYGLLRRRGAAFCVFDMQGLRCPLQTTADFAYMRFHGTGERYGGNYTDAALEGWADRLRALGRGLDDVWVYFNNDLHGHAPRNAAYLQQLLDSD